MARSETEREERDWAAGLYFALPRPDGWRVTASSRSVARQGLPRQRPAARTLPCTHSCRVAMHSTIALFHRALKIDVAKSVSLKKIKQCQI